VYLLIHLGEQQLVSEKTYQALITLVAVVAAVVTLTLAVLVVTVVVVQVRTQDLLTTV
jgi:hypothetical protein